VARLRVVVDTSSLVRAALNPASAAGRLIDCLLSEGDNAIIASAEMVDELAQVLARPKFRQRLSREQCWHFLLRLQATVVHVVPGEPVEACRDPADNMGLEAALAAGAEVLVVSDDRDLLTLDPWRGVRIVKPEAALLLLGAGA